MGMASLFYPTVTDADLPPITGLRYLQDYVSESEEKSLVEAIDGMPWNTQWRRRRQPYGVQYGAGDLSTPIPDWGRLLADRMWAAGITDRPFDQMLVNEYETGQGIAFHKDYAPFGRTVVSLSLLSSCVMDFRQPSTGRQESLLLKPRSVLILADDARYDWEHGIAPRKQDIWQGIRVQRERRLSITFRFRDST